MTAQDSRPSRSSSAGSSGITGYTLGMSAPVHPPTPSRRIHAVAAMLVMGAVWAGCGLEDQAPPEQTWEWELPQGFPAPKVPEDNPMSAAKVELGRFLFYDRTLSFNNGQSCASCHRQDLGFSDGLSLSFGTTGMVLPRNSMGLANVAYQSTLTWANPNLRTLEDQIMIPLFGEEPVEMGVTGHEQEVLGRFQGDADYVGRFAQAFPGEEDPVTFGNIVKALASFCRSMISTDSPYDRWAYQGDDAAMSLSAKRGLDLFFSEQLECFHCHGGFNFALSTTFEGLNDVPVAFQNTGLYNIDGEGAYPVGATGLYEFTGAPEDMGKFRTMSLRNITVTGPYLHDGTAATLDDVLDIYAAGGRVIESGDNMGDGTENPHKSGFVNGFVLTDQQRIDVRAFLESLTDETFLTDPALSDPFVPADTN